jgi:hypothetical protein
VYSSRSVRRVRGGPREVLIPLAEREEYTFSV